MHIEIKNGNLVITCPIEQRPSKSGKNIIIASTGGNQLTAAKVDGKAVIVGLNAYISR